ncbi:MAG TPA: hypothetical protein DCM73_16535 [Clostridiales bacterium]|nr:hypothetical protein [Clostridiales bacterium]
MGRKGMTINFKSEICRHLRTAVDNEEFFLCYQPIIDSRTRKLVCSEALIRWKNPVLGIVSPGEFIPVAEKLGNMESIGNWVMESACEQLGRWHQTGYRECSLSVNVSALQLQHPDFANVVLNSLSANDLTSEHLMIEITENIRIDKGDALDNLLKLRKEGIKISIDDFGTGYNCMKYFQKFECDFLKIDVDFVNGIKKGINKIIIDTIIKLAHEIDAAVIAEGVETREQYEYLADKGCDMFQGYYFSKPLSAGEMLDYLREKLY